MPTINLGPFAQTGQGKQLALTNLSNLLLKLPDAIQNDRAYSIERQKFGDNDTANEDAFKQLQQIAGDMGLDASIIPAPQTGQDHNEYLTRGIATFWTAAMGAGKTQEEITAAATKLTGGGGVPQVAEAQEGVFQRQEIAEKKQIGTEGFLSAFDVPAQPLPSQQPQQTGPFGELIQGQQEAAVQPAEGQVLPQDDPELDQAIKDAEFPTTEEAIIRRRLATDDKFTDTQAWEQVLARNRTLRKKRKDKKEAKEESDTRLREEFAQRVLEAPGVNKLFDAEGNPVDAVTLQNMLGLGIGTGKKIQQPASVSVSIGKRIGRETGTPADNIKLLNDTRDDTQSSLQKINDIDKYRVNKNNAIGAAIALKLKISSPEDATRLRKELGERVLDNINTADQLRTRLGLTAREKPDESKKKAPPPADILAKMNTELPGAWDFVNNPDSPGWTQEKADRTEAKLRQQYGF